MEKRIRQYAGILFAILLYYVVHEGAHLLVAVGYGVFKQINLIGLGIQIDVHRERMTAVQLGIFCLAGALMTFLAAWFLVAVRKNICRSKSKYLKTFGYYGTLALLLTDPVYLMVVYRFVGGGDMNGIKLLVPEVVVQLVFGVIGLFHLYVIKKLILPDYTEAFREAANASAEE